MDTAKAAQIMTALSQKLKHPNYQMLGSLITRKVEKNPKATVEDLTKQVLRAYEAAVR